MKTDTIKIRKLGWREPYNFKGCRGWASYHTDRRCRQLWTHPHRQRHADERPHGLERAPHLTPRHPAVYPPHH